MSNRTDSTEPEPKSAEVPSGDSPADQSPSPPERWDSSPVLRETFLRTALGQVPAETLREASRVLYFAILSGDDTTKPNRERVPAEHVREALQGAAVDLEHLAGFLRDSGMGEVDKPETKSAQHWRATAETVAQECAEIAAVLWKDPTLFSREGAQDKAEA